jgi:hypothetical protein
VTFDYAVPRETLGFVGRIALDAMSRKVARAGEPFRGFFAPAALIASLKAMGYAHVDDIGSPELDARYFSGRTDALHAKGQLGRLMSARG